MVNTLFAPTWLAASIAADKLANSDALNCKRVLGGAEVGDLVVAHDVGEREGVGAGAAGQRRAGNAGDV